MIALAVGGPMPSGLDAGFDVWLPLYAGLALALVVWASGTLTIRLAVLSLVAGMVWSWSVNRIGVIEAGGFAILIAMSAASIRRRRARRYDDPDAKTGFSAK